MSKLKVIAKRAARLAVRGMDGRAKQIYTEMGRDPYKACYEEYLDQLQTGDDQQLRTWLGMQVEAGVKEAVWILKMWIRARIQPTAGRM